MSIALRRKFVINFDSVVFIPRPTNASPTDSKLSGDSDSARVSKGLSRKPYRSQRFWVSSRSMASFE